MYVLILIRVLLNKNLTCNTSYAKSPRKLLYPRSAVQWKKISGKRLKLKINKALKVMACAHCALSGFAVAVPPWAELLFLISLRH